MCFKLYDIEHATKHQNGTKVEYICISGYTMVDIISRSHIDRYEVDCSCEKSAFPTVMCGKSFVA